MIGLLIKLLLSGSSLFYTFYLFYCGSWGWGIVFIFVSALFILVKYLKRIKQPQFLVKRQRAYYYYLVALSGAQTNSMGQAESLFRKALTIGLKRDHDKAMAKMNIAAICMGTGRRKEAELLLTEAKKLDTKGILTEHIKGLKKQMGKATSANQMRMSQMAKGQKGRD